jgi:DNA-binding XRE family transcriptional regulator
MTHDGRCRRCRVPFKPPELVAKVEEPKPELGPFKAKGDVVIPLYWLLKLLPIAFVYYRTQAGMRQRDLAARLEIPKTYISKVENGAANPLWHTNFARIAEALGVTRYRILRLCEEMYGICKDAKLT